MKCGPKEKQKTQHIKVTRTQLSFTGIYLSQGSAKQNYSLSFYAQLNKQNSHDKWKMVYISSNFVKFYFDNFK